MFAARAVWRPAAPLPRRRASVIYTRCAGAYRLERTKGRTVQRRDVDLPVGWLLHTHGASPDALAVHARCVEELHARLMVIDDD